MKCFMFTVTILLILITQDKYGMTTADSIENGSMMQKVKGMLENVTNSLKSLKENLSITVDKKVSSAIKRIPGAESLIESVNNLTSKFDTIIENISSKLDESINHVKDLTENIKDNAKDVTIINYNTEGDPNISKLLNRISESLNLGKEHLEHLILTTNDSYSSVTDAGENFVVNLLEKTKTKSGCTHIITQAEQDFTQTLMANAKVCVYNVINVLMEGLGQIDEIQKEIKLTTETGRLRAALLTDSISAINSILTNVFTIEISFPVCRVAQLTKTLMYLGSSIAKTSSSCISSLVSGPQNAGE